jgi:oligopeptide transport system ATP-binding protein
MQQQPLLEVKNLKTRFKITGAYVHAVNGITYSLNEGDSLGVVGESGCGKSVGVMSVMRLIPQPPGEIYEGEVLYGGRDLLKLSPEEMRHVRGKEIAMIFQDPMTSLNPVMRIGRQITEALELHMGMDNKQARARAAELLTMVGIPRAADRLDDYPHQFSGGMRQRVMIAMPMLSRRRLTRSAIWAWIVTSSAVVGSSAIRSCGLQLRPMAIMTRWRIPPENWWG